jgi:hypothetical protein
MQNISGSFKLKRAMPWEKIQEVVDLSRSAVYPPLQNPLKWVDMDLIIGSKTLATCKVLVSSVKSNLISV